MDRGGGAGGGIFPIVLVAGNPRPLLAAHLVGDGGSGELDQIGRASCRERVYVLV